MTQHPTATQGRVGHGPAAWEDLVAGRSPAPPTGGSVPGPTDGRGRARRRGRGAAALSAVALLLLVAADLVVAAVAPVHTSTCSDRLCGPGLGVGAAVLGVALLAVVWWLLGDVRRDRGRGLGWCWAAVVLAALPVVAAAVLWTLKGLPLRWW